jgi:hypothetical protein
MGRRAKAKEDRRRRVVVSLPPEHDAEFKRLAKALGVTRSGLLRRIIATLAMPENRTDTGFRRITQPNS